MPVMAPIFAAIGAAASTAAGAVVGTLAGGLAGMTAAQGVGVFVANLGFANSFGAGLAAWSQTLLLGTALTSLAMKPKLPATGGQVNLSLDPQAPVPQVWGRTGVGGTLVYRETWDEAGSKNNSYLGQLIILNSGGPSENWSGSTGGFESITIDNYNVDLNMDPNTGVANVTRVYTPNNSNISPNGLFQKNNYQLRFGRGYENPDTVPVYSQHITPTSWPGLDGHSRLSGLTFATVVCYYNKDQFPAGLPRQLFTIRGQRCYDPRLDDTFTSAAGNGSGPQRLNDPSTWTWTENPYLMALKFLVGWSENGQKIFGVFVRPSRIDWAAYVNGANIADANNWKAGGETTSADSKFDTLVALLQAGGGVPIDRAGQVSCLVYAPQAVAYTITSDDVVGSIQTVSSLSWRDRINQVFPTYREESQWWNMYQTSPVTASTYVDEDGGEKKTKNITYNLVQNATHATQLAGLDLVNSREFLNLTLNLRLTALNVRAGQCVTVDIPEIGADSIKMLVVARQYDPSSGTVQLTLRTETDSKYDWAMSGTGTPPDPINLTGFDPANPPAPGPDSWAITDTSILGPNGEQVPALVVQGAIDDPLCQEVFVYVRAEGGTDADWHLVGAGGASATKFVAVQVAAGVSYQIGVSYLSVLGVESPKLVIGPATAGSSISGGVVANGIDWFGGVIANTPVGLDSDANGRLYANNISYGGTTVNAALDAYALGLQEAVDEIANAGTGLANTVANVAASVDDLAASTLDGFLREKDTRDLLNNVGFVSDVPVGAFSYDLSCAVVNNNTVFTDNFSLLGGRIANNTAWLLNNTAVYVDANTSLVTKFQEAQAYTDASYAIANNQITVLATNLGAVAQEQSTFEVHTANNFANALHLTQVVSDFANATALDLSYLGVANGTTGTFALDETTVFVGPGVTIGTRLSGLDSNIANNAASINTEAFTRASNDNAIACSVTVIGTTVAGHTASITDLQTSVDGINLKAGVALDSNGYITGWELNNDGSIGSATFVVNQFSIVSPGSAPIVPFEVIGDTVYMLNVVANSIAANTIYAAQVNPGVINTDHLTGGAVTGVVQAGNGSSMTFSTTQSRALFFNFTNSAGGNQNIFIRTQVTNLDSQPRGFDITIWRNGVEIDGTRQFIWGGGASGWTSDYNMIVFDSPGAGTNFYEVYLNTEQSGISAQMNMIECTALEYKR